jgi:GntR family transcriptional regulator/MocR family aminotransferase
MSRTRTSSIELLVRLERDDAAPLHQQLEHQLRAGIRTGRLKAGSALPSTRALAEQLALSRGVVVEAYEQLVAEGYLTSQPGGATRVCAKVLDPTPPATPTAPSPHEIDFAYGRPDVVAFPRQDWLRSIRRVLDEAPADRLTYLDGRGVPELREALAIYLNRVRGTDAHADHFIICNGFTQGFALFTDLVRANGGRRIALEDPGYHDAVVIAERSGLTVVRIPVDEHGMRVDLLDRARVDAVAVTPAHQYPTGAVLSPERRAALVAWSARRDRLILEDDYDAEFRYDRDPIGALHGLASDRVVYSGTASKTLAPGLRLGWLIVPGAHVDAVAASKTLLDGGSAALEQLAFADFLARGEFDHHLRRMRPVYRARRDALLDALGRYAPDLRPVGASAGLHVLAWLPRDLTEPEVSAAAATLGVGINGLSRFGSPRTDLPGALLFGYGTTTERQITDGVRRIGQAIAGLRTGVRASA